MEERIYKHKNGKTYKLETDAPNLLCDQCMLDGDEVHCIDVFADCNREIGGRSFLKEEVNFKNKIKELREIKKDINS